tara:strand:- start:1042 stop:1611 length:570 start_codon:yes stop_codon:yes gene_type:complete
MEEFNLRNYLYKNPLLEGEDQKERKKHYRGAEKDDAEHIKALEKDMKDDKKADDKIKENVKESALRKAIQNEIISILKEAEVEDVDVDTEEDIDVEDTEEVDVDVDKEVDIDDESAESEIEVDDEVAGQDAGASAIEGLLKKARELAKEQGDRKLVTQLSNTITQHERSEAAKIDQGLAENNRFTRRRK